MVLLDDVVQVSIRPNFDVTPEGRFTAKQPERSAARDVPIDRDLAWAAAMVRRHGLSEEGLSSGDASVGPQ